MTSATEEVNIQFYLIDLNLMNLILHKGYQMFSAALCILLAHMGFWRDKKGDIQKIKSVREDLFY